MRARAGRHALGGARALGDVGSDLLSRKRIPGSGRSHRCGKDDARYSTVGLDERATRVALLNIRSKLVDVPLDIRLTIDVASLRLNTRLNRRL